MRYFIIFAQLMCFFPANGQLISTFAGGGTGGDGDPATIAQIEVPHEVAFDKFGNFYFIEYYLSDVRKVDTAGIVSTVAGNGIGYSGDGGPATLAMLFFPQGLACDTAGNLYISDCQNYRIRRVDAATGIITTIAGSGYGFDTGDGGPASSAGIYPFDIHFDHRGNLYFTESSYNKIRKIRPDGVVTRYAGTGVAGFSGDNGPATAAQLWEDSHISVDSKNNLYFADDGNHRIRKIDTFGIITTVVGNGVNLYNGEGVPASAAQISPISVGMDLHDRIFFADANLRIRMVDSFNLVYTVAGDSVYGYNGDGIPATHAEINGPGGIAFDACDNLYFADALNNRIRKVTFHPSCDVETLSTAEVRPVVGLSLYPNPANDFTTLTSAKTITKITIWNMPGQQVYEQHCRAASVAVNVASLPPGTYIVAAEDDAGGRQDRLLMIQR